MSPDVHLEQIWVYLSASPLFGFTMTLMAYGIAYRVYWWGKSNPLLNPVVIAVLLLIALLVLTDTTYQHYFEGGQFVHFLLGPATVALAVPLYQQAGKLKTRWLPVCVALVVGTLVGGASAVGIARLLGADTAIILSIAPKSVTAPVAMGIAERIGGIPSLTAALVVMTGVVGAVLSTKWFALLRIRDDSVCGIAMGVAAHGIGTARAFQVSTEMGAFAGLAMALSAVTASVILPWLMSVMH